MKSCEPLIWDSEFFGIKICRIVVEDYYKSMIAEKVRTAFREGADLIYLIIPELTDRNEIYCDHLVDTKIIYEKKVSGVCDHKVLENIHSYSGAVTDILEILALSSGEYSRFRKDKKFPDNSFERLYSAWVHNSVIRKIADEVFVYDDGKIKGMVTLKFCKESGTIGIISSESGSRGKGIGSALVKMCENELFERGIPLLDVATQKKNTGACRFYEKNGFCVKESLNYYHLWKENENTL